MAILLASSQAKNTLPQYGTNINYNIMKRLICLVLSLLAIGCYNGNAQGTQNNTGKVIIAVNTPWGVGYFADANGNMLLGQKFDFVRPFQDGLAAVKKNGRWGFVDVKGNVVVPYMYEHVWNFSGGMASVKRGGKYGLVNK